MGAIIVEAITDYEHFAALFLIKLLIFQLELMSPALILMILPKNCKLCSLRSRWKLLLQQRNLLLQKMMDQDQVHA